RPQDLVSSDNLIDRSLQRLKIEPPLQPDGARYVVCDVTGIHLVDEPQPLLREREREPFTSLDLSRGSDQRWGLSLFPYPQCFLAPACQAFRRCFFEDAPDSNLHSENASYPGNHLRRQ